MTNPILSYGKILTFGDADLKGLLDEPCYIQEKIDGSQISFMVNEKEQLLVRSKGSLINLDQPQKLFVPAICTIQNLHSLGHIPAGLIFRGEAVATPRHNKINYKLVPAGNIVLYDVHSIDLECDLHWKQVKLWAAKLGIAFAPVLGTYENPADELTVEVLKKIVAETKSVINDKVDIEGVVIKRLEKPFITAHGKVGRGKYVSDGFKEMEKTKKSIRENTFEDLAPIFAPEARKHKMVMRLKEEGKWTGTMRDMALLVPQLIQDVEEECLAELKDMVYKSVRKKVRQGLQSGLAEWYKEKLGSGEFK